MAQYRVTSPDGQTYNVTGPDGATQDEVLAQVKAHQAANTPAPAKGGLGAPTQQDQPMAPYVWNRAKQGLASLAQVGPMAADIVSMPLRPYERALGMNVPQSMFPATQAIGDAATRALHIDPNMKVPTDAYGKPRLEAEMLGNIANFAGMSAIPSAGVVAKAEVPLTAAAKEVAGVVMSGIGQTEGEHLAPKGHEAIGGFAGSLSGPMLAQKGIDALVGSGNWISTAAKRSGVVGAEDLAKGSILRAAGNTKAADEAYARAEAARQAEATAKASQVLGPSLRDPKVQANIAEANSIAGKVPGFGQNLTLGRTTNAPGVQSLEKHFGAQEDTIGLARQRATGLESAIGAQTERRFPQPQEATAISGIQRDAADKVARSDEALKRLDDQERALALKYQRGDQEAAGLQAQTVRAKRMAVAKSAADAKYQLVDAAARNTGMKVNISDVRDLAEQINKSEGNKFQKEPGVIGDILRSYTETGKKAPSYKGAIEVPTSSVKPPVVSLSEFQSLLRRTNEDLGALNAQVANGTTGAANQRRLVMQFKDLLEKKMTEMEGPQHGQVGALLKDANSFYKNQYAKIFREGVGGEMGAVSRFGQTSSNENAKIFSNLVLKPHDPSGMREYLGMVGNDPHGMQALENGVMDIMARKVTDNTDGTISRTALNNFLRDNKQSLDLVPSIRKKIESVDAAAASFARNRTLITAQRKDYVNSTLRKVSGSDNPDATVAMALRSPRVMTTLINSAKTVDEKAAVARGIVDKVMAEKDPIDFLTKNKATLESALGKRQVSYLTTILKAKEIAGRVEAPSFVAFTKLGDPLSSKIGTSIPQALSEQKAVTNRFASAGYAYARVGMRWWNTLRNDQREKIIKDAIYDPDLAKSLADYIKEGTPVAKKALNPHLIPYMIRAAGAGAQAVTAPPPGVEARAEGGPVVPGKPYLVGENGPELIVPHAGGTVLPNDQTMATMSQNALDKLRYQNADNMQAQQQIAPFEHQAFYREEAQQHPLAAPFYPAVEAAYQGTKALGIMKALGQTDNTTTPASIDQIIRSWQGTREGLMNYLKTLTN